jgi:short-subunit dehydrogenase
MKKNGFTGRKVWITGASSGIGRAVAIELSRRGAHLAVTARNQSRLQALIKELDGEGHLVVPADLCNRQTNLETVEKIIAAFGTIDIAVFNAGNAQYVDIKNFDSLLFEEVMKINVMSMVYGIEAVLPVLRSSKYPHLVGMSSLAGYFGMPRSEAYGASKAAVRNMLQALRISLIPEKIPVSIICPGFVKTPLTDKNDFPMPMIIAADRAAKIIVDGIEKQKEEIYFPFIFAMLMKLIGSLPSSWQTRIVTKITKPK